MKIKDNVSSTNCKYLKIGDRRKMSYLYRVELQRIMSNDCYDYRKQSYRIILYPIE